MLSPEEKERLAELVAERAPFWRMAPEPPHSRFAIRRAVKRLKQPAPKPRCRSPVRLSLTELQAVFADVVSCGRVTLSRTFFIVALTADSRS